MDKEPYEFIPHRFTDRVCGKQVCVGCGLIALNNKFTDWAIDKGCDNLYHPSYKSQRRKTNDPN